LLKIKLINGNITDAPRNMRFFDKRLLRARLTFPFSSTIIGNSNAGLAAYGVPKNKGICIYNGFDANRILNLKDKTIIRKQFKISTEKVVGMVGSFSERKDFDTFIDAALILLNKRMDVTFVAVGEGPNLVTCKKMIPSDFSSYFKFTGVQRDVESIINVFDIGVLSTNTSVHGEGISNAILEYMALEKPVIATIGGGTNEVVIHEKTGVLIPPDSPQVMADQLTYLLDNPMMGRAMGVEGRLRISDSFSLTKMTTLYHDLYHQLLN
jgi:glycosyltransferase involved in cell wall biosynthesis